MAYKKGGSRKQTILFPQAIDDYITEENPVRFLEFITDFMRRFSAPTVIGLALFIVIPVLLLILKIGTFFVFPMSVLGAFIILIALLRSS